MIFHTKLPGLNVNVGKLVLGLGQLSMKNHTQHDLWHLYSTHLSDPTPQLCVSSNKLYLTEKVISLIAKRIFIYVLNSWQQ